MKPSPLLAVFSFAAFIGIAWDVLFYDQMPGISVPIFWLIVLGGYVLFDRMTHRFMSWREIALGTSILVLSSFFAIRTSTFLLVLDAIAIAYLFLLFLVQSMGMPTKSYRLFDYLLFLPFEVLGGWLQRLDAFRSRENMPKGFWLSARAWLGIAGALVFVLIFVGLFASADAIFAKYVEDLVNWESVREALGHALVILIVFFFSVPFMAAAFWKRPTAREIPETGLMSGRGIEALIILGASNVVFALFLFVQFKFLFAGQGDFASFNLTYAEYARRGFFQLLIVAFIVAAMTWFARRLTEGKLTAFIRALQTLLVAQTVVVIASSWMRLSLYEAAYGFTHLRLFSHYFLIVVAAILVLMLTRLFGLLKDAPTLLATMYVFVIGLVGLNLLNPDALIAKQNLSRDTSVVPVDRHFLLSLSDDAAPLVVPYLEPSVAGMTDEGKGLVKRSLTLEAEISRRTTRGYVPMSDEERLELNAMFRERDSLNIRLNNSGLGNVIYDLRFALRGDENPVTWQSWNWSRVQARELRNRLRIALGMESI